MTAAHRIAALDVLRGCAVLGILWMNVTAFALPSAAYFNPAAAGPMSAGDMLFWAVSFVLADGKMRGLFSLLFGASILLFVDREEMAGRNGARSQIVRWAWLLLFGVAHYVLLWWGDILMVYALIGPVALLFMRLEPLDLVKRAFLAFLLHFLICALLIASLYFWANAAAAPNAPKTIGDGYSAFMGALSDPASPDIRAEYAVYRGDFATIVAHHLKELGGQWVWSLLLSAFDTLGFMLLGMAMLKAGFLTGRWEAEQYRRTARHCFLIGLPPMMLLAGWIIASGFAPLPAFGSFLAWSFPFRIPLTVGWAVLLLWMLTRIEPSPLIERLAAAGRMTLSNYLGSSLLMTTIFYGWGLGLFGTIRPAAFPLFVAGGWALILLWSKPWIARFGVGPMEWLWRRCAGLTQKIRKND